MKCIAPMFFEDGVTLFSLVTQLVTLEEVCIQPNKIHRLIHCVGHENSQLVNSQSPTPIWMSVLNTANVGRIERGPVAMGCVFGCCLCYTVLNEDSWKRDGPLPRYTEARLKTTTTKIIDWVRGHPSGIPNA